jgi:rSAM/selenodomain-associated transferase 2/rSAM/selenodomain-associated transferase 1
MPAGKVTSTDSPVGRQPLPGNFTLGYIVFNGYTVKVIIPALNESASIGHVLSAIPEWVDEIIVADNGSTDDTADIAARHGGRVVYEPRRGYGQACLSGMAQLGHCDIVVFLDADFSDYPQQMNLLVESIAQGKSDMVLGSRTMRPESAAVLTPVQRFGNALSCRLMRIFWGKSYTDLGPFRAIKYSALRTLQMRDKNYGWTIEMQIKAVRAALRVSEVPVGYRQRIGSSKISGTIRGVFFAGSKILWTIFRQLINPTPVNTNCGDRLFIFSRYPHPGRTKTRLISALGRIGAAQIQRQMTFKTISNLLPLQQQNLSLEIRYTGCGERKMRRWLGPGFHYTQQGMGNLGARMERAVNNAFARGSEHMVLIGADCPELRLAHIKPALEALNHNDLVLGPSDDGGYWLIALRHPAPIFDGIDWGTSNVLKQTLELARQNNLTVHLLEELTDLDTPDDLERLGYAQPVPPPYLSVIIPTLNEAENIEKALHSAQAQGVEIIVVDGNSCDETVSLAQKSGAKVLTSSPGRVPQMNKGAATAQAEVLLFLHADTLLPSGYADMIFNVLSDSKVVGGAFAFDTDYKSPTMSVLRWLTNFRALYLHLPYGDQAIFVRKNVFQALGGFPEVPIAEDLQFIRRVHRYGRLEILPYPAVTSGRRWRRLGPVRTTIINQLIVFGSLLGISPKWLKILYQPQSIKNC